MLLESLRNITVPSLPTWFIPGRTAGRKNRIHVVHMHSWHTDRDGNILWVEDGWYHNILHTQGEKYILSRAFDIDYDGTPDGWSPSSWTTPNTLYLGLDARETPTEADTLASITGEPVGNGYERLPVSITTGFELQDSGAGYWRVRTPVGTGSHSFSANGGNWTPVTQRFLCTDATSKVNAEGDLLIATVALSTTRTLNDGDNLNTNMLIGLSEA